jgi:hypothetical protein
MQTKTVKIQTTQRKQKKGLHKPVLNYYTISTVASSVIFIELFFSMIKIK